MWSLTGSRTGAVHWSRWLTLTLALLLALLMLLLAVRPAAALERRSGESVTLEAGQTVDDDLFITGSTITIGGHVTGDLYALGNSVTLLPTAQIDGDVIAGGNLVALAGRIGGDLRTFGNMVTIDAAIGHNAVTVGSQLTLGPTTTIKGNLVGGGSTMTLLGSVDGRLTVGAEQMQLDGRIGRDAELWLSRLTVAPTARIGGNLTYTAATDQAVPASVVMGAIQRLEPPVQPAAPQPTAGQLVLDWLGGAAGLLWLLGAILLSWLLSWQFPGLYRAGDEVMRRRGGLTLVLGLVTLIVVPVAVLLLLISMIGLPLGLLTLGAYFGGWYVGWLLAAPLVMGLTLTLLRPGRRPLAIGWLAMIGLVALHLLTRLPFIGGPLALVVLTFGVGLLTYLLYERWRPPVAVAAMPPLVMTPPSPAPAL